MLTTEYRYGAVLTAQTCWIRVPVFTRIPNYALDIVEVINSTVRQCLA